MTDTTAETLALFALVRACRDARGVAAGRLAATVERVGSACAVLAGDFTAREGYETRVRAVARRTPMDMTRLGPQLADWQAAGIAVTTVLDAGYPANLRAVADHPPLLWFRGTLRPEYARSLAVAGTRAPTVRASRQTRQLVTALARAGVTVVSGVAAGIDAEAHSTTLAAGGRTLGVLGHGLARPVYPREHTALARVIADHDALVSPFMPDTQPAPATFRARNAITSGLSLGTLVIEAGPRSGARLQARLAAEQGRPVYLLRSLHDHQPWARELVRASGAIVVDGADDLLTALAQTDLPATTVPEPEERQLRLGEDRSTRPDKHDYN